MAIICENCLPNTLCVVFNDLVYRTEVLIGFGGRQWATGNATTANVSLKHHQNAVSIRTDIQCACVYYWNARILYNRAKHIQIKVTVSRWMQTNFSAKCKQCVCVFVWRFAYGFNVVLTSGLHSICYWTALAASMCARFPISAVHTVIAYRIFAHQWICNHQSNIFDI